MQVHQGLGEGQLQLLANAACSPPGLPPKLLSVVIQVHLIRNLNSSAFFLDDGNHDPWESNIK